MDDRAGFGEREFAEALESSRVGAWSWTVPTGEIRWSKVTRELLGAPTTDLSVTLERYLEHIHPEERERLAGLLSDVLDNPNEFEFSIEHRVNLEGEERWLWGRGHIERNGVGEAVIVRGSVVDVTERKRSERALAESRERVRLFAEHATDYVYEGRFEGAAPIPTIVAGSFERTVGFTPEEVTARGGWIQVIHPDDRARTASGIAKLMRGESLTAEYRIIDKAGSVRWLRDRVVPILGKDGKLERIVGGVTDITEQVTLRERLVQSEKMDALARLASGVAHDFNNLLTILMGECDLLLAVELESARRHQCVEDIQATLQRASQLTTSLLALGKTQHGKSDVLDLARVIEVNERVLRNALPPRVRLGLLPIASAALVEQASRRPSPESTATALRIALVEDEPLVREITEQNLESLGHEVSAFGSAEDFLAATPDASGFDLVITDVGLPGLDGLQLVTQLRRAGSQARMLVISGLVTSARAQEIIASGEVAFLSKPFSRRGLVEAIERVLESESTTPLG